jgi:hypothetical protein
MERTYNEIMAENIKLQNSLDVITDMYGKVLQREKALKAQLEMLKKQLGNRQPNSTETPNNIVRVYGATDQRPNDCKVISMNPQNK